MELIIIGHDECGIETTLTTYITVRNTPPTAFVELQSYDGAIPRFVEGDEVSIRVAAADPSYSDIMNMPVTIDWGDGSPVETVKLNADHYFYDDPAWPQQLNWHPFRHRYLNDPPDGSTYTIRVTATDNDTGSHTATMLVTVENVAPTIVLDPIPDIFEGDSFVVSGKISDPGVLDTLTLMLQVDLNWDGDYDDAGETIKPSVTSGPFSFTFSPVLDDGDSTFDGSGEPLFGKPGRDPLTVIANVSDSGATNSASRALLVQNLVPRFVDAADVPDDEPHLAFEFDEDGKPMSVTIQGQFEDDGSVDYHRISVLWGDGQQGDGVENRIAIPLGGRSFSVTRLLPAVPEFDVATLYPVTLGVQDDDSGDHSFRIYAPVGTSLPHVYRWSRNAFDQVIPLWDYFDDPDNSDDELHYTVVSNTNPSLFTSTEIHSDSGALTLVFAGGQTGIAQMTIRATDTTGAYGELTFKVYSVDVRGFILERDLLDDTWLELDDTKALWEDQHGRWTAEFGPTDADFQLDEIQWLAAPWAYKDEPTAWATFASADCDCRVDTSPGLDLGQWAVTPRVYFGGAGVYAQMAQANAMPDEAPQITGQRVVIAPTPIIQVLKARKVTVYDDPNLKSLSADDLDPAISNRLKDSAFDQIKASTSLTDADLATFDWAFDADLEKTTWSLGKDAAAQAGVFMAWKLDAQTGATYVFAMPFTVIIEERNARRHILLGVRNDEPIFLELDISTAEHESWHFNGTRGEKWKTFE